MTGPSNAAQRACLKLRQNPKGEWEVYASIHGTSRYRWWIISESQKKWYMKIFPEIQIVEFTNDSN